MNGMVPQFPNLKIVLTHSRLLLVCEAHSRVKLGVAEFIGNEKPGSQVHKWLSVLCISGNALAWFSRH